MSQTFKVPVRVSKIIREFIVATNGSDTIRPTRQDLIWGIVKQNLITQSCNSSSMAIKPDETVIYIELLNCNSTATYCIQPSQGLIKKNDHKNVMINIQSRHYLSLVGERKIARHLRVQFSELFHTFMLSAHLANPTETQIDILYRFLETYNIHLSKVIKEETLLKSWRRSWRYNWLNSRQRKRMNGGGIYCPLIF